MSVTAADCVCGSCAVAFGEQPLGNLINHHWLIVHRFILLKIERSPEEVARHQRGVLVV